MEPFRPVIDLTVWRLQNSGPCTVNPDTKRALVQSLYQDLPTDTGRTPVLVALQKLAISLTQVQQGDRKALDLPLPGVPLRHVSDPDD
jgi:CRISPR-associated protein Cas1